MQQRAVVFCMIAVITVAVLALTSDGVTAISTTTTTKKELSEPVTADAEINTTVPMEECPVGLSIAAHLDTVEQIFSPKVTMCSDVLTMDQTDTPPAVNQRIIDMYASILRIPKRNRDIPPHSRHTVYRAVDMGSGCGYKLHSLTSRYDVEGFGVDISLPNVAFATKTYAETGVVRYCHGDVLAMPHLLGRYELVIEFGAAVKYAQDECTATRQALALLKPNGRGAFFRGFAGSQITSLSDMVGCLFDKAPVPTWRALPKAVKMALDAPTPWVFYNGTAFAFMRFTTFYPKTKYRRSGYYFVFVVRGVSAGQASRLPPLSQFVPKVTLPPVVRPRGATKIEMEKHKKRFFDF